ncbi:hypothetical protein PI124_g9000 [Phytophthora idaei]|nr:hypothetical protein PI125_g9750 [Phytophthora idaei]KAG3155912.1 hypothetical protein PI126_g8979 [Phytophthora idaei]KAG3246271.1 hypothetical protein PI124_g9000 [Phytophthora idaei]
MRRGGHELTANGERVQPGSDGGYAEDGEQAYGSDGKSWEPYDCDLHTGGSSYTVEGHHTTDRAVDMEQRTPMNESQPLIGATGAKRA